MITALRVIRRMILLRCLWAAMGTATAGWMWARRGDTKQRERRWLDCTATRPPRPVSLPAAEPYTTWTRAITLPSRANHEPGETPFVVLGPDKNPGTPQAVRVVDSRTGQVLPEYGFVAYEDDYVGGTRVALADLDGDGIDEIITAPGRNRAPEVSVFTLEGDSVPGFPSFLAYSAAYSAASS